MIEALKFVQGAVAKKDFLPSLTHFRIENGTVRGYNGTIALSSPIPLDIDCVPKAIPLVKAIQNCKDIAQLSMTPAGRLAIKSGNFRAYIECVEDEVTPHVEPEGEVMEVDGEALLAALKALVPFIGSDASRPWSNGVLLCGPSAFATNNIVLTEYWIGIQFPVLANIPAGAVKEMVRLGLAPAYIQADKKCLTFHYDDGRWLRTQLLDVAWPDVRKILDVRANPVPIPEQLYEALESVKHFTDKLGRVYIQDGVLSTTRDGDEGARFELDDFPFNGIYQLEMLSLLNGVATEADFSNYPKPCAFFGGPMRGVIIGIRGDI